MLGAGGKDGESLDLSDARARARAAASAQRWTAVADGVAAGPGRRGRRRPRRAARSPSGGRRAGRRRAGRPGAAATRCSAAATGVTVSSSPTTTTTGPSKPRRTSVRSGRAAMARWRPGDAGGVLLARSSRRPASATSGRAVRVVSPSSDAAHGPHRVDRARSPRPRRRCAAGWRAPRGRRRSTWCPPARGPATRSGCRSSERERDVAAHRQSRDDGPLDAGGAQRVGDRVGGRLERRLRRWSRPGVPGRSTASTGRARRAAAGDRVPHAVVEREAVQEDQRQPSPSSRYVCRLMRRPPPSCSGRPSGRAAGAGGPGRTWPTISSSTRRTADSPTHRCFAPSTPITSACGTRANRAAGLVGPQVVVELGDQHDQRLAERRPRVQVGVRRPVQRRREQDRALDRRVAAVHERRARCRTTSRPASGRGRSWNSANSIAAATSNRSADAAVERAAAGPARARRAARVEPQHGQVRRAPAAATPPCGRRASPCSRRASAAGAGSRASPPGARRRRGRASSPTSVSPSAVCSSTSSRRAGRTVSDRMGLGSEVVRAHRDEPRTPSARAPARSRTSATPSSAFEAHRWVAAARTAGARWRRRTTCPPSRASTGRSGRRRSPTRPSGRCRGPRPSGRASRPW